MAHNPLLLLVVAADPQSVSVQKALWRKCVCRICSTLPFYIEVRRFRGGSRAGKT